MPTLNAAPAWRSDAAGWPRSLTTGASRCAGTSPATSACEPRRTGTAPPEAGPWRACRNPRPRLRSMPFAGACEAKVFGPVTRPACGQPVASQVRPRSARQGARQGLTTPDAAIVARTARRPGLRGHDLKIRFSPLPPAGGSGAGPSSRVCRNSGRRRFHLGRPGPGFRALEAPSWRRCGRPQGGLPRRIREAVA